MIITHRGVALYSVHWKPALPLLSLLIIRGCFCVCVCLCLFLRSNRPEKRELAHSFNCLTTKWKVPVKPDGNQAEVEFRGSETKRRKDRDLIRELVWAPALATTWVIDCSLMCGARSLISHHHPILVSTQLLIFTFNINICEVTINMTIISGTDLSVSSFG